VNRNPHSDFAAVEAARSDYDHSINWNPIKTPNPQWKVGDGASSEDWKKHKMISIDPSGPEQTAVKNYKLMISSTVPRPIALVSTISKDGQTTNLSPFSYFQNVCSDPPLYSLSLIGVGDLSDTARNILETGECSISIISDWFIEAANYTSTNTPPSLSEWPLSGLTPRKSDVIEPTYVGESAFSIECKLHSSQEIKSPRTGLRSALLVIVEAVRFHVREDALAEDKCSVDLAKLRPIWRAGGISYGCAREGFELPRPEAWRLAREREDVKPFIGSKAAGQ